MNLQESKEGYMRGFKEENRKQNNFKNFYDLKMF